jgi:hypothetical protein
MTNSARRDGPAVDLRHLLVIGAGPGLGGAIAHRFAQGGYHLTLLARRSDELAKLEAGPSCSPAAAGRTTQARPGPPCHSARPLRSAATMLGADLPGDGIRVASITIAGQIRPGTPFSPDQIAERYWSIVQSEDTWQSEFRFDGT